MKYLVSRAAVLCFSDGTKVELTPGAHSFDKKVVEHWAFSAHARPLEESDLKQDDPTQALTDKITELESTISDLQKQVTEKDGTISDLQKQVTENAKKQSSANK